MSTQKKSPVDTTDHYEDADHFVASSAAGLFTTIANAALCDPSISYRAKGILAACMTHVCGTTPDRAWIDAHGTEGRDAITKAIGELRKAGYLADRFVSDGRTMRRQLVWADRPALADSASTVSPETRYAGSSDRATDFQSHGFSVARESRATDFQSHGFSVARNEGGQEVETASGAVDPTGSEAEGLDSVCYPEAVLAKCDGLLAKKDLAKKGLAKRDLAKSENQEKHQAWEWEGSKGGPGGNEGREREGFPQLDLQPVENSDPQVCQSGGRPPEPVSPDPGQGDLPPALHHGDGDALSPAKSGQEQPSGPSHAVPQAQGAQSRLPGPPGAQIASLDAQLALFDIRPNPARVLGAQPAKPPKPLPHKASQLRPNPAHDPAAAGFAPEPFWQPIPESLRPLAVKILSWWRDHRSGRDTHRAWAAQLTELEKIRAADGLAAVASQLDEAISCSELGGRKWQGIRFSNYVRFSRPQAGARPTQSEPQPVMQRRDVVLSEIGHFRPVDF